MGPIFIILGAMEGIHIPADGLPRDYELLRGKAAGDASRRHRPSLLGLILVILHNNIIFYAISGMIMELLDDIIDAQRQLAKLLTQVNDMDVPHEIDDIADNAHRHLVLAYRLLDTLHYEATA